MPHDGHFPLRSMIQELVCWDSFNINRRYCVRVKASCVFALLFVILCFDMVLFHNKYHLGLNENSRKSQLKEISREYSLAKAVVVTRPSGNEFS